MEPPPPAPDASGVAIPPAAAPANPALNYPPYDEMILAAVTALQSAAGSSKKEISDYMEQTHPGLPSNHSALLPHHLRSLKVSGRLAMSKNCYRLPEPGSSSRPKRGRPPKNKAVSAPDPKPVVLSDDEAPKSEEAAAPKPRRAGRPAKKRSVAEVEKAAPPNGAGRLKRGRGRPAKVTMVPFASEAAGTGAGPQGKVEASRAEKLPVKRRGRPRRTTVGRPRSSGQSAATAAHSYAVEYEILQKKVEVIQTRIKDAVAIVKPHLIGQGSSNVMSAIIDLEAIAAMDIKALPTADTDATTGQGP